MEMTELASGRRRIGSDWIDWNQAPGSRDFLMIAADRVTARSVSDGLRRGGWTPHVVHDRGEAASLLKLKEIPVGLIQIGPGFEENDRAELLEIMGSEDRTQWIAVVDPAAVDVRRFAGFLSESFFDFHTLPLDAERLAFSMGHAFGAAKLAEAAGGESRRSVQQRFGLIGGSQAMAAVYSAIEKIAPTDQPVIISGESGAGKEMVARAIHGQSDRCDGPFVTVNCAGIPDAQVQEEFFGYLVGAFPGATQDRIGYLEGAHRGTLFLDDVEDLSPIGQASLLRFIEEKRVTRLGAKDATLIDVRVIVAARDTLGDAVAAGRLREDLFYRLNVLQVAVPPLRERGADSVEIAQYTVDVFNRTRRKNHKRLSKRALDRIMEYHWPGNVRELVNCINRAAVCANGRLISDKDLGLAGAERYDGKTLAEIKARAVEQALMLALTETRNVSSAARQLGVSRVTLYRLMERYSIRIPGM